MSESKHTRAKEIFLAALEKPSEQWGSFLDQACQGNPELRSEVASLLDFHQEEPDATLAPNHLYAERYRIVRLLGRGGMGEVYHAHDETLDVPVALKRLTEQGDFRRESLLNEVRLARQVTHPTVCRVYDLGDWQGEHFVTMEMVEGEDLSSLLRRVGRLPSERVAEIARELCVGLAAAHAKGVLHRDLKPANILIDSEGKVRITDFGIAAESGDIAASTMAGTPSYMAPEQLVPGGVATERSDLYALGLVLHEMLSGKPVFPGVSRTEVLAQRRTIEPRPLSGELEGIDADLERIVLRALELDPRDRPASALEMSAALPGGDPLLVAMEARATPSPQVVAGAPSGVRFANPANTGVMLAALLLLLGLVAGLADSLETFPANADTFHPEVGSHRAEEALRSLGYDVESMEGDSFHGFIQDPTTAESSLLFWYRFDTDAPRSSFQKSTLDPARDLILYEGVTRPEPGRWVTIFDARGDLVYFEATTRDSTVVRATHEWDSLFALSGLEISTFTPVDGFRPPGFADAYGAWTGPDPHDSNRTLRIEAASLNGRPVYFSRGRAESQDLVAAQMERLNPFVFVQLLLVIFVVVALVMSVRNLRGGRADTKGTLRLVAVVALLSFLRWLLLAGHMAHPQSNRSELMSSTFLAIPFTAVLVALFYSALEPSVRRHWPHTLVAWTRVLHGYFRNMLVGRSLLLGAVVGCLWALLYLGDLALPKLISSLHATSIDSDPRLLAALGLSEAISVLLREAFDAIARGGLILFVYTLLRTWLRKSGLATIVFVLIVGFLEATTGGHHAASILTLGLPIAAISAWLLTRAGLLTYVVAAFVYYSLRFAPLTLDFDAWWASSGLLMMGAVAMVGILGGWLTPTARRKD